VIVERKPLRWWERLYLPAVLNGLRITLRHFFRRKVTMQYPEEKWVVPPGYRGAPYLVRDQAGRIKCVACQLCEFICPPKAIRIVPPGPAPDPGAGNVEKRPKEFDIDMLRCIFCGYCQEVCPEEAIFLQQDYSLTSQARDDLVLNVDQLLELGGTHHDPHLKWRRKAEEARVQNIGH
jgi:NADH-quinone oxidoreductase subunit I